MAKITKRQSKQELLDQIQKAISIINKICEEYEVKPSFDKARQLENVVRSINQILYNEGKNIFAIPTELKSIRELLFSVSTIDGILESFNTRIERFSKRGEYDKVPQEVEKAKKFNLQVEELINNFNKLVISHLEEGYGSRRDIVRHNEQKQDKIKQEIYQLYAKDGELFSKVAEKFKGSLPEETLQGIKVSHLYSFLEANKEKIIKNLESKKSYLEVANLFEITENQLFNYLNEMEKDEKLTSLFEEINEKTVNELIEELKNQDVSKLKKQGRSKILVNLASKKSKQNQ